MKKIVGASTESAKYPKRGPVIMPVKPPYDVLRYMAGDPVILAASDEAHCRNVYQAVRLSLIRWRKGK